MLSVIDVTAYDRLDFVILGSESIQGGDRARILWHMGNDSNTGCHPADQLPTPKAAESKGDGWSLSRRAMLRRWEVGDEVGDAR
jgi:hypothetical protein